MADRSSLVRRHLFSQHSHLIRYQDNVFQTSSRSFQISQAVSGNTWVCWVEIEGEEQDTGESANYERWRRNEIILMAWKSSIVRQNTLPAVLLLPRCHFTEHLSAAELQMTFLCRSSIAEKADKLLPSGGFVPRALYLTSLEYRVV